MSLENLLRMRPRGVVSKNDIGERKMFPSILLWMVVDAKIPPNARAKEPIRMKRAWSSPRDPYTPRNIPTELPGGGGGDGR